MLELIDICFEKDSKKILNNINLKIDDKSFIAITGPNGSGKSTLAKIIMGIEKPNSGKILFNGTDITNLNIDERANLGISFAFQQPVRFKGITIYDILKLASHNKKLTKQEACHVLRKVGICAEEYLNRELNSSLSGGELKRIEIATVLLRQSKLNIFDEPEAGIDLWSFNNLINIFQKMHNDNQASLIITHQERILNIADKIILIKNGKIDYFGSKKTIIENICANCPNEGGCDYECC